MVGDSAAEIIRISDHLIKIEPRRHKCYRGILYCRGFVTCAVPGGIGLSASGGVPSHQELKRTLSHFPP